MRGNRDSRVASSHSQSFMDWECEEDGPIESALCRKIRHGESKPWVGKTRVPTELKAGFRGNLVADIGKLGVGRGRVTAKGCGDGRA